MNDALDLYAPDLLARLKDEQPSDATADQIGRYAMEAFRWLNRSNRIRVGHRKLWQSDTAYLLQTSGVRRPHWFTLVTSRKGRTPPLAGYIAELIHNDQYSDPMAHIITPTHDREGILMIGTRVNDSRHLSQIEPIVREIVASRLICAHSIPGLLDANNY